MSVVLFAVVGGGYWAVAEATDDESVSEPPSQRVGESNPACDPSYPYVSIPPPPPDLGCAEIPETDFRVTGDDPHYFDRDNNGIGCDS